MTREAAPPRRRLRRALAAFGCCAVVLAGCSSTGHSRDYTSTEAARADLPELTSYHSSQLGVIPGPQDHAVEVAYALAEMGEGVHVKSMRDVHRAIRTFNYDLPREISLTSFEYAPDNEIAAFNLTVTTSKAPKGNVVAYDGNTDAVSSSGFANGLVTTRAGLAAASYRVANYVDLMKFMGPDAPRPENLSSGTSNARERVQVLEACIRHYYGTDATPASLGLELVELTGAGNVTGQPTFTLTLRATSMAGSAAEFTVDAHDFGEMHDAQE